MQEQGISKILHIRMDELEMLKHAWAVDPGANCTNL